MPKQNKYDCIIIGGGFFGAYIALYLKAKYQSILLLEQESDLLLHASLNNQARVHNGYHYPRSLSTAISSSRHFQRFCREFAPAIKDDFSKYYAIANIGSKTSSVQFFRLFKQFGIPIESAPYYIKAMFDSRLISDVFSVRECVFDAHILRSILKDTLHLKHIEIAFNTHAICVREDKKGLCVDITASHSIKNCASKPPKLHHNVLNPPISTLYAPLILNCTYAGINDLLFHSHLPPLPLKFEMTEMALVSIPSALERIAITIMDGSFFSLMPYPAKATYTLSHVRYTPHFAWQESVDLPNPYELLCNFKSNVRSSFPLMRADCKRYMPLLESLEYVDSLYEIKTLQVQNEIDDGRPIVFAKDYGLKGFCTIMGGKIDNIYEIIELLETESL
ncbi:MAG: FAD-dependent oxidoreductase [Helicobacter sp.]|uniref:FAD-dependent oxidoreductase n=1 Tax=Helicobacter sp. TaxID=218 RepID=UPI0025BF46AD|nr:FAD-dependent oxidoreductase [Helicobacter sp.]MCH5314096.1 FAD-dependent oxidoreductase [Helicobacter sp.]